MGFNQLFAKVTVTCPYPGCTWMYASRSARTAEIERELHMSLCPLSGYSAIRRPRRKDNKVLKVTINGYEWVDPDEDSAPRE